MDPKERRDRIRSRIDLAWDQNPAQVPLLKAGRYQAVLEGQVAQADAEVADLVASGLKFEEAWDQVADQYLTAAAGRQSATID